MTIDKKPYAPSILCQQSGGCMGCCGNSFESKKLVELAIKKNTVEFKASNPKTFEEYDLFRDRAYSADLRNGVCRNLISIKIEANGQQLLCPLHPTRHSGVDLRKDHCNIHYLCKTAKEFKEWDKEMQKMFLEFINKKNVDNIDYSLLMAKNILLHEFKESFLKNNSEE